MEEETNKQITTFDVEAHIRSVPKKYVRGYHPVTLVLDNDGRARAHLRGIDYEFTIINKNRR